MCAMMEKLRIRSIGTFSTFPPSYFLVKSSCVVLDAARVATPDERCWDTPDDEKTVDTTGDGASGPAVVLALALAL